MTCGIRLSMLKILFQKISELKQSIEGNYCKLTSRTHSFWNSNKYDWRNNIEITGIFDNIWDQNLEDSVIAEFKAANFQMSHSNIEDFYHIGKPKDNSKKTIGKLVNQKYCK